MVTGMTRKKASFDARHFNRYLSLASVLAVLNGCYSWFSLTAKTPEDKLALFLNFWFWVAAVMLVSLAVFIKSICLVVTMHSRFWVPAVLSVLAIGLPILVIFFKTRYGYTGG